MKQLLLLLLAVFIAVYSKSQSGTLDLSFGDKGFVTSGNNDLGINYAVVQQTDGKIITAGGYDDANGTGGSLARFLVNGMLDSSYGKNGYVLNKPLSGINKMLLLEGNRLLILGTLTSYMGGYFCVARLKSDGSFDSTFGSNGFTILPDPENISLSYYSSLAQAPDGTIYVGGELKNDPFAFTARYTILSRFSPEGRYDTEFGDNGRVISVDYNGVSQTCLATEADGKILMGGALGTGYGRDFLLSRYNTDGTLDESFGVSGNVITGGISGLNGEDLAKDIAIQADGNIVLGGYSGGYNYQYFMTALRFLPNGKPDNSFGTGGKAFIGFDGRKAYARTLLQQPDGKFVLAGDAGNSTTSDFALCRLNRDGSVDSSFGIDGRQVSTFSGGGALAYCATLQKDGRILVGGSYYNEEVFADSYLLARYNGDKRQKPLIAKIKRFLHNHGIGWQGLDNIDIQYYSVQYSSSGKNFTEKGRVSGSGSSSFKGYDYSVAEAGYYRVVAIDHKGYKTFSNKVLVSQADIASATSIYPNPARSYVTVQGLPINETANIAIKDGSGTVLARGVSTGSAQYSSPLGANMQAGTYYLNITTGSKTKVLKFVKE